MCLTSDLMEMLLFLCCSDAADDAGEEEGNLGNIR